MIRKILYTFFVIRGIYLYYTIFNWKKSNGKYFYSMSLKERIYHCSKKKFAFHYNASTIGIEYYETKNRELTLYEIGLYNLRTLKYKLKKIKNEIHI